MDYHAPCPELAGAALGDTLLTPTKIYVKPMRACRDGKLAETEVRFADGHACCVILASQGYPESYEKGFEITVDGPVDGEVYFAGARAENGKLLSDGGRVLGVTATGATLREAVDRAYAQVPKIRFGNAAYRKDIGARALRA